MKAISIALLAAVACLAFGQPVEAAQTGKFAEKVIHHFRAGSDGVNPYAGVIDVKGTLYGTTFAGGSTGFGTLFSLDPKTGAEKVLYSFGDSPEASPIDVNGVLYGTTAGRSSFDGTVFSFDPKTGVEATVYTFCSRQSCADGESPVDTLLNVNGTLYGTTLYGGNTGCGHGCGTVFSLDPKSGVETVLYSFKGSDGQWPTAGLIEANGVLYGTATYGGISGCGGLGCGTLFSFDPGKGTHKLLYSFCSQANCADGAAPDVGLIDVNGTLYGTTAYGGASGCGNDLGCGTLYSVDPKTGAEKVLYSFCSQPNCADGSLPESSLIDVSGKLYGTTGEGGSGTNCVGAGGGCGTVFALDPNTGAESTVYSFSGTKDGNFPVGSLIVKKGSLYGMTIYGGGYGCNYGCGTVFVLGK